MQRRTSVTLGYVYIGNLTLVLLLQVVSVVVVLAHAQGDDAGNQDAGNEGEMKNMMKKLMDQAKQAGTKMSGKAKEGMGQMKQGATKMSGKAKGGMGQMKKQMGDGQQKMQGAIKQAATEAPSTS